MDVPVADNLKTCDMGFKCRYGPDGLHIFNRKTGVNVLVDEVTIPAEKWSKAPRQVSIALTNSCDLQCTHCYAPKQNSRLDFNLLCSWLHALDKNGCMGVGFGGGEPTLYPQFLELCEYASNETSLAVTMTTHAHRLTEDFLDNLAGNIHFVRVSMDGIKSTYEKIRGRPFDQLVSNVLLLKKVVPFGVNYVVNAATVGELDEAVRIVEDMGASEFLLLPEVQIGRGVCIESSARQTLVEWIHSYSGNVRLAISEMHAEALPICEPFSMEGGTSGYAHIDALGVLKETSFDVTGEPINGVEVMDALGKLRVMREGGRK